VGLNEFREVLSYQVTEIRGGRPHRSHIFASMVEVDFYVRHAKACWEMTGRSDEPQPTYVVEQCGMARTAPPKPKPRTSWTRILELEDF
jgi:hypothetical protein